MPIIDGPLPAAIAAVLAGALCIVPAAGVWYSVKILADRRNVHIPTANRALPEPPHVGHPGDASPS